MFLGCDPDVQSSLDLSQRSGLDCLYCLSLSEEESQTEGERLLLPPSPPVCQERRRSEINDWLVHLM